MLRKICFVLIFICLLQSGYSGVDAMTATSTAGGDCGCDYVIPLTQWLTDAQDEGIGPGDLVCLEAGSTGRARHAYPDW